MRLAARARIPERHKKEGLCYAVAANGIELPVIDMGHPAFELDADRTKLNALLEKTKRDMDKRARMPAVFHKLLVPLILRGSLLAEAIGVAQGSFLSGFGTYLLKLGPENLGRGYAKKVDCAIAA